MGDELETWNMRISTIANRDHNGGIDPDRMKIKWNMKMWNWHNCHKPSQAFLLRKTVSPYQTERSQF
jgi:hypothetical protein